MKRITSISILLTLALTGLGQSENMLNSVNSEPANVPEEELQETTTEMDAMDESVDFDREVNDMPADDSSELLPAIEETAVEDYEAVNAEIGTVPELQDAQHTRGFYQSKSADWGKVANERQTDPTAWDNYYRSQRYGATGEISTDIDGSTQSQLNSIVDSMAIVVPNSFEYNYCSYLNSNFDVDAIGYLEAAYNLEPDNPETYDDFIAHYELTNDSKKKEEFCELWYESGEVDQEVLDYNYNVLQSLERNAILVTNGELDTYPIWVLQEVDGVRTDVTVLNMNLMKDHAYRNRKMKELGLNAYSDYGSDRNGFLEEIAERNPSKHVYFGLTVSQSALKEMQDYLYLTGLAFRYSNQDFDNMSVLVDHWENDFEIDYLNNLSASGTAEQMQQNYLIPLLTLSNHYLSVGELDKAGEASNLALKLAKATRNEDEVEDYLNKE